MLQKAPDHFQGEASDMVKLHAPHVFSLLLGSGLPSLLMPQLL
jgi:hypothetical protein